MKRATTWALAVVTAMTVMACAGTPMEQANELIERHEASMRYMVETNNNGLPAREAEYEGIDGECERRQNVTGVSVRDRLRYGGHASAPLQKLENELRDAVAACHAAERPTTRRLRTFRTLGETVTEEVIQESVNRLRVQLGRAGQEAVGMILDGAESDEAAWASLVTALGNEAAAEMLTREQIDTGVEEEVTRFTEGITELQTAREEQQRAREKWEPILAEIKAGTWNPETGQ